MNFLAFTGNREFIKKLTEIILANLEDENFGVSELVKESGLSHSNIHRRLNAIEKKSISQFIREIRLQKAMELLQQNETTASEIGYKVGFRSPAYFNTCFHEYYGFPPGEVKKRGLGEHDPNDDVDIEVKRDEIRGDNLIKGQWSLLKKLVSQPISILMAVLLVIILLLSIYIYLFFIRSTDSEIAVLQVKERDKSLAVLPFKNLSMDQQNQYFADGVMEGILNRLIRIRQLRVISRTSVEQFRNSAKSAPEIAKMLDVRYILEGSVQREENKVKVTVQLIDARHEQHVWSDQFDRELTDIFSVQSNIALRIANELQAVLTMEEIGLIEQVPTKDPAAYDAYLMGLFYRNKRTAEGLRKSVEYFQQAIEIDSTYGLAYAGLAESYYLQTWWGWVPRGEGYRKSNELVHYAIQLDKNMSEAHAVLGALLCWDKGRWKESERELLLAIELNQNNSVAYQHYAELMDLLNRKAEARNEINKALGLDPYKVVLHSLSAYLYYNEGKPDNSLQACEKAIELDSSFIPAYWNLLFVAVKKMDRGRVLHSIDRILMQNSPKPTNSENLLPIDQRSEFNEIIEWMIGQLSAKPNPDSYKIARLYALIGKKEESLDWLERAKNEKTLTNSAPSGYMDEFIRIQSCIDFVVLHNELRFKSLVKPLGVADYVENREIQLAAEKERMDKQKPYFMTK